MQVSQACFKNFMRQYFLKCFIKCYLFLKIQWNAVINVMGATSIYSHPFPPCCVRCSFSKVLADRQGHVTSFDQ